MTELEKRILEQIEQRRLAPRPYAYFLARRSVFWTLAIVSILLGAISVDVMIYGALDYFAPAGQHEELPFEDWFESVPFVWLLLLVLFVASAFFGLQKTRRGYRYRVSYVLAGTILASAVLGVLLHRLDVGKRIHQFLNANVPAYERMIRSREDHWTAPDQGRLGGRVLAVGDARSFTLKDFRGREWMVDFAKAKVLLSEPLLDEGIVAIRGVRTGKMTFRADAIEEWD